MIYPSYVPKGYDPEITYEIMQRNKGKEGDMKELQDYLNGLFAS